MTKELVINALEDAINHSGNVKGCILHSDRGSQYCSNDYSKRAKEAGFTMSMSRKGNCWDNAPMESFWGKLKQEWLNDSISKPMKKPRRQYLNISGYFTTADISMRPMVIRHRMPIIRHMVTG